jgi:hypothetical protein
MNTVPTMYPASNFVSQRFQCVRTVLWSKQGVPYCIYCLLFRLSVQLLLCPGHGSILRERRELRNRHLAGSGRFLTGEAAIALIRSCLNLQQGCAQNFQNINFIRLLKRCITVTFLQLFFWFKVQIFSIYERNNLDRLKWLKFRWSEELWIFFLYSRSLKRLSHELR